MWTKSCFTLFIFVILLSLFLCQANVAQEEELEDPNAGLVDWKEAHYQVYAREGKPLGYQKTLDLLKELRALYQGRKDFGSVTRSMKVERLLDASKISKDNCNRKHFDKINKLIDYHFQYKLNIGSYLDHCFDEQMKFCFPIWSEFLFRWKKMFNPNNVFYQDPSSVLNELKGLMTMLSEDTNNILQDEKDRLGSFIELSVIKKAKCNTETSRKQEDIYNNLTERERNHIEPYAAHFIQDQVNLCNKKKSWKDFFSRKAKGN